MPRDSLNLQQKYNKSENKILEYWDPKDTARKTNAILETELTVVRCLHTHYPSMTGIRYADSSLRYGISAAASLEELQSRELVE